MDRVLADDLPALHSLDAVTAGLSTARSSGQVEGQVTRAELFKHMGCGRPDLDLLRKDILRTCGEPDPVPTPLEIAENHLVDELLRFLHARYEADNHAYAEVAYRYGGDALLDSHLPMLDLVDMLAREYEAMDPSDTRLAGLRHALRVLAQSYAEHPDYRAEWRP